MKCASSARGRRMVDRVLDKPSALLLMTLFEFDQAREQEQARAVLGSRTRAKDWRAIEYGPDVSQKVYSDPPMRAVLRLRGLVSDRIGSLWLTMEGLGLIVRSEKRVEVRVDGDETRVASLFVALTRQGRSLAKGSQSKERMASTLSESAWRVLLLAAGRGPSAVNTVLAWQDIGKAPPDASLIAGVVSGLSKRGLVDVESWAQVTITPRGSAFVREQMAAHCAAYVDSGSWAIAFGWGRSGA